MEILHDPFICHSYQVINFVSFISSEFQQFLKQEHKEKFEAFISKTSPTWTRTYCGVCMETEMHKDSSLMLKGVCFVIHCPLHVMMDLFLINLYILLQGVI